MRYVDGYVVPVPKKKLAVYRRMAQKAGKVWRDHGALEYIECIADDVKPGKHTSFPQSVKLKPGETVVFAYIVYKSRADRDRINAKVMKDPRLGRHDGPQGAAFRRQAHVLGRFQGHGRGLRVFNHNLRQRIRERTRRNESGGRSVAQAVSSNPATFARTRAKYDADGRLRRKSWKRRRQSTRAIQVPNLRPSLREDSGPHVL